MSYILCIETSTTNCSVSISENGKNVALKENFEKKYSHAEKLHIYIKEILNSININISDLSAIAISKGPGSYTGLRIGVSTAKGLCFAANIPLISINTLTSLATKIINEGDCYIIPMLDARRMEVYSAVYSQNHKCIQKTKATILEENSYASYLNEKKCFFIGDGVDKFKTICKHSNAFFINTLPSSSDLCQISFKKFENNTFESTAYFEPFYLKDFIAGKPKKRP